MIEDFEKNILVDVVENRQNSMAPRSLSARLVLLGADNDVVLVADSLVAKLRIYSSMKLKVIHLLCSDHQGSPVARAAIREDSLAAE
jgi:hypothetical protein